LVPGLATIVDGRPVLVALRQGRDVACGQAGKRFAAALIAAAARGCARIQAGQQWEKPMGYEDAAPAANNFN
jgi:hypothetical protein